ncbi:MAG: D-alanyl-D-alanine carboxypeptidase family protein [Pseudomonadota bacterium]
MIARLFAVSFASLGLALAAFAQSTSVRTEAEYAVIMDYESGEVLFSKDGDVPMIPASMTKIMTAYVVFDRLRRGEISLTDQFTTSENAWRKGGFASGGSTMGLAPGDQPTVEELLRGVIILSGNDACIVLAEGLSGSEEAFAEDMTALAAELGLETATFKNATGLDEPGHRMSAVDLAHLAKLSIEEFPELYALYAETSYEWRGISQPNRNPLLGRMDGADGLKTGHLSVSGYGLTASAERDGQRRIVVVNGLDSIAQRAQESERLMRLAFTAFETRTIVPEAVILPELDVWLGQSRTVAVSLAEPMKITAHKRALEGAKTEIVLEGPLEAPITTDEVVGNLVVTIEGRDPVIAQIVADESVARLGFFGRAIEGLSLMISGGES